MKVIKESNRIVSYQDEINGQVVNIDYKKDTKEVIIKIESNILSQNNYLIIIGKIYRLATLEIKDFSSVNFEFYPMTSEELERAEKTIKEYNIRKQKIINPTINKKATMIENYFKTTIINKNVNGKIVNYIVRQADQNNGEYLLENVDLEMIKSELRELLNHENINFDTMSESQITNIILDKIANDRKQHLLNPQDNYQAKNEYEQASLNATNKDDLVNTEIGVIKKNPEDANNNTYRTIEQDGDKYAIANPSINEVSSIEMDNNNPELTQNEIEARDEEKIYYIDGNDIYNQNDELIGNLTDGYIITDENHLVKNGEDLGLIDNIKNKDINRTHENVKVKKLEKPRDNNINGIIDFKTITVIILLVSVLVISYLLLYINR